MHLWMILTSLTAVSLARPVEHPGVASYQYVSTQLATVIEEIKQFDWRNPNTELLYRHSMETLETLNRANRQVREGPELGYYSTTEFTPTLMRINYQIHSMTSAIKEKRVDIERAKVGLVFYTLLKQCYSSSIAMRKGFEDKMPKLTRTMTKPIIEEVIGNIGKARDWFIPPEGDVAVVIVTEQAQWQPEPYPLPSKSGPTPWPQPTPYSNSEEPTKFEAPW